MVEINTFANTWFKKLGLDSKIQVSFSIFNLFLTWDNEVAVYSPTFSNHGNVVRNFNTPIELYRLIE